MTDTTTSTATVEPSATRTVWVQGPALDLVLAFGWVPAFVAALAVTGDALGDLTKAVLLLSFCHQPVTLPLVYGDATERRRLAAWLLVLPAAAIAAVYLGLTVSVVVVSLVAGLWNAHHTLRQRYGLLRIYGRKVGQADGDHEQHLLFSWFLVVLLVALAGDGLIDQLQELPVGFWNAELVDVLDLVRPLAVLGIVPALAWALWTTRAWSRLERARPRNRAKHVYLAGVATSFAIAPFAPVAALLGFVSAHSVEYLVVVAGTVRRRVPRRSLVGRAVAPRGGPVVFLVGYVGAVLVVIALVERLLPLRLFLSCYLAIGVLHFVYDGMIWRLRRPDVAATFAIEG